MHFDRINGPGHRSDGYEKGNPFFNALVQGNEKAILGFWHSRQLNQFDHSEFIAQLPLFIQSFNKISSEGACRAAMILRTVLCQVILKNPRMIDDKACASLESMLQEPDDNLQLQFELIVLQKLIEGTMHNEDISQCFERICRVCHEKGVLLEMNLPERALRAKKAITLERQIPLVAKIVYDKKKQGSEERLKRTEREFQQEKTNLKSLKKRIKTESFEELDGANLAKTFAMQLVMVYELSEDNDHYRTASERFSEDDVHQIVNANLKVTPQEIEEALDEMSQSLQGQFRPHLPMEEKLHVEEELKEPRKRKADTAGSPSDVTGRDIEKRHLPNAIRPESIPLTVDVSTQSEIVANEQKGSSLRNSLVETEKVTIVSIQKLSQKDLLKIIEEYPENAEAYCSLAQTIPPGGSIKLNGGNSMTRQELLIKAIELDPKCVGAYHPLAEMLPKDGGIVMAGGKSMSKQDLLIKAIELDPACALIYVRLAETLRNSGSIAMADGKSMSKQELLIKAIELDPTCALVYDQLAETLPKDGSIVLADGKSMTKQELYIIAIELDPEYAVAYSNLGYMLPKGGSIVLAGGKSMTKQELYIKAIELDPNLKVTYSYLAQTLPKDGSIVLADGKAMTKQELIHKY